MTNKAATTMVAGTKAVATVVAAATTTTDPAEAPDVGLHRRGETTMPADHHHR